MLVPRLLTAGVLSIAAAGCAIRPLPQDVTGFDTYQIVSKIRCETRDAVRGFSIEAIRKSDPQIAADLENRVITFRELDRRRLHPVTQRVLERYDDATIAYEFTFDITEKNHVSGGVDLLKPFTRGPLRIGLAGGSDRERQNLRNFRVFDTFENLISIVPDRYCEPGGKWMNWVYPITGSLNLVEMVGAFLDLNQSGNLTGLKNEVPTLADTIQFTTKFAGSAHPSIVLSPMGRGLQLVGAHIDTEASREDMHQVIIVMTLPPEAKTPAARLALRPRTIAEGRLLAESELDRQRAIAEGLVTRDLRRRLRLITE